MLGAVGFSPEQLEIELNWIDEHIGDHPYGVDIVIPNKYEGMDADMSTEELTKMLQDMVPQGHLDFARKLLADHGVPLADGGRGATRSSCSAGPRPRPRRRSRSRCATRR